MNFLANSILVSWGCCNQLGHTGWLQRTEIYYLTVLEARSLKLRCQQDHVPSDMIQGSQFLVAPDILWLQLYHSNLYFHLYVVFSSSFIMTIYLIQGLNYICKYSFCKYCHIHRIQSMDMFFGGLPFNLLQAPTLSRHLLCDRHALTCQAFLPQLFNSQNNPKENKCDYYIHLRDGVTETQRGLIICSWSH